MLDVLEDVLQANDLLERAEELHRGGQYLQLDDLLQGISPELYESTPELIYLLGNANFRLGRYQRALGLIRDAEEEVFRTGNTALFRRYRNLHGVLMLELGHLHAAEKLFAEVAWLSHETNAKFDLAVSLLNLGVTADIQCEWETALVSYNRAIAFFEEAGRPTWVPRCRHNIAMTYRQLGRLSEARSHLDMALGGLILHGTPTEILCSKAERALLAEVSGDHVYAAKLASTALSEAEAIGDQRGLGELLRVSGIIFRAEANLIMAKRLLARGLRLARRQGTMMLVGELLEEIAACQIQEGKLSRAAANMSRTARILDTMGAEMRARAIRQRLDALRQSYDLPL